jgi:hypothetical protein
MTNKAEEIKKAIMNINRSKQTLKNLDVLRSDNITRDFGRWVAEILIKPINVDFDSKTGYCLIDAKQKRHHIKAHSFGDGTTNRWTLVGNPKNEPDFYLILVFNSDHVLKEAYHIPFQEAMTRINFLKKQMSLDWNNYPEYSILETLRNNPTLKIFLS